MKIAQIVCSFPPYKGGIGNSAKGLAKLLSPEIDIHTFTTEKLKDDKKHNKNNLHKDKFKAENTNVFYLKPLLKLGQAAILPSLFFKLKKYDAIILHYPFFGTNEILYLYRLFNKKQKLYIYYHMDVQALNPLYKILSLPGHICGKALIKQADKVIVSSLDYLQNSQIKKLYQKEVQKYKAISFHINEDYYHKDFTIKDKNNIQLLFVGGLDKAHYFKGVENLIKATAKIKQKNWTLNIVGNGELLNKYKKLVFKLNLNKNINFLNNVDDKELKKIYEKADIIILPSFNKNEAFGLVLIEAMANSTAVIASNLKGVSQVFNDDCGLKVIPGSIIDLKNKIESIINKPTLIQNFKKEAFYLAQEKYLDKHIKEKWLNILKTDDK
ncbi:glycosyltransferase [Patescibacteria group bacterium]|nr:glycosyltransferase [Patescibacteria group bacterium]